MSEPDFLRSEELSSRRGFLSRMGQGVVAGGLAAVAAESGIADQQASARVARRRLGKTGLLVSEIGFGGHSWSYARVPDGAGGLRKTSADEAARMISLGLEMGVNFFDSCTPREEHSVPGEVIQRLGKRDQVVVSARLCHKMKGAAKDRDIIYTWVDERLKLWQTDRFDLLMLTNTSGDTPASGYWDMSYSLEAIEKLKQQGKIRFAGFGCHFQPEHYVDAFAKFGRAFDVVSLPYNVRHRGAEAILADAEKIGLGVVTIKPLARGELLEGHNAAGAEAGLARDMIAFVLENPLVDCCICGVHTESQTRENFSASGTKLTPQSRARLDKIALRSPAPQLAWLENGWLA